MEGKSYSVEASMDCAFGGGRICLRREGEMIVITMEGGELFFTVEEAKEIAEKITKLTEN